MSCARVLFLLLALVGPSVFAAAAETPWPSPVPGFKAPAAGEHPRLFFRASELADLKKKAATPEGQAILKRLRFLLNGGDGESMPTAFNPARGKQSKDGAGPTGEAPPGMYTFSHSAGYGLLHLVTGDKKFADLGREAMEKALDETRDRDNRYSFKYPYGALRAGVALGWTAVGYDLGYAGWDDAFRRKVADAIMAYNEGSNCSLEELVRGSRHMPASNHWGMQVGGGALAVLALAGDPGTDPAKIAKLLAESRKSMIRQMTEGFGDHGWYPEGDGTGSMASVIVFVPALQAWRVAGGQDFVSPRPNAPWMTLKWLFLTVPRGGKMDFPARGAYPHNIWDREGLSGTGYFAIGLGGVTPSERPALLWFYNEHLAKADAAAGAPFDTVSVYPHLAIMSFVNWPSAMEPKNPAQCLPRAVLDEKYGFAMFRNRWQDEHDVVVSVQTLSTKGWHKATSRGEVVVWGMGKKREWGNVHNGVRHWQPAEDGSGVMLGADGTCLAVDFSRASGADAILAMTGPGAPAENAFDLGGTKVSLLVLGDAPQPQAGGSALTVGGQSISVKDGLIVLGKMAAAGRQ
jgi:hypothetical protein